ncbi:MAG TPA: hypothetical protein VGB07_20025 [Blastocatellia bacterium]
MVTWLSRGEIRSIKSKEVGSETSGVAEVIIQAAIPARPAKTQATPIHNFLCLDLAVRGAVNVTYGSASDVSGIVSYSEIEGDGSFSGCRGDSSCVAGDAVSAEREGALSVGGSLLSAGLLVSAAPHSVQNLRVMGN